MKKHSKLFTTILSTVVILFFVNGSVSAQDDLDKIPLPVGGITAISKNIVYPESAKKEGIEGKVIVVATVDDKGDIISIEVKKSVNKDLDAAAVAAVKKTAFSPGEKDGNKVKATVTIPIQFKLNGNKEDKNGSDKKS